LAVDNPGLVGMQPQPDLAQPDGDPPTHIPNLLLAEAMDHNVIAVPFERDARELPGHPLIERIVQEEIRQQRAYARGVVGFRGRATADRWLGL